MLTCTCTQHFCTDLDRKMAAGRWRFRQLYCIGLCGCRSQTLQNNEDTTNKAQNHYNNNIGPIFSILEDGTCYIHFPLLLLSLFSFCLFFSFSSSFFLFFSPLFFIPLLTFFFFFDPPSFSSASPNVLVAAPRDQDHRKSCSLAPLRPEVGLFVGISSQEMKLQPCKHHFGAQLCWLFVLSWGGQNIRIRSTQV